MPEKPRSVKVYYTSHDPAYKMTLNQFIETEVHERGNYTLKEVQGWMRKYNLTGNDFALWVSPLKWVANRYNLFAEDWDKARFIPESEMSVYEIKGDEGFIIPESNDGEAGYLFVFHRPTRGEAIGYMVYESWTPADVSSIVSKIVQEVKEKPWTATQKRAEIVARLRSASDEIDRNIITEIQSFRPLGAMSEFAEVMMGAGMRGPKKGEPVRTPFGTIVFNEKRVPSKDRVARWDAEHEKAEELRKIVPEYAFALEARPNTTTGNFRVVEHARRLKAQGLLSTEEEKVLDALERYWQSHPELDREKGYGIWAYNLELMVPERLRAEALSESLKHEHEKLGGTIMAEQSGKLYTVKVYELVGVPTPVRKSKTVYTNVILERVKEIIESSPNYEYDIFDPQGNPVQFIKLFGRSPDYTAWSKKMDEERRRLEQERRKKAGISAQSPQEQQPSQEVKAWMKRALNIEDYKGGRHDRIQMLALLLQNSELGNVRSISDAGSMALALGKDLGYGTPPAYGKSFERYYAEKIAEETGKEVPIIKSSDIIKPYSKEPLKSAEELYALYTEGYAGATFLGLAQQDTKELADSILFDLRHLNLDPAIYTKDVLMAYAVKWKEWAQKEWDTISAKVKAEKELKWAEEEKKIAEEKKIFWNEVKNLKITDVQVEFAPGEAARGYRNIYLNTYVILENGKRVRMNNEIFKGRDVTEAQKLGLSYFRNRKLFMVGETVEKNVREDFFLILNRYDEYVKQIPVPVQQQFIESGAVTGGTPARQILTVTQPEEYYFGTQVEVMQGADPELEPYFTGTIKRLLNNGELVEVHPEGDPMEVSFRVPVDRVNVVRLVEQQKPGAKPKKEIWQMTQREFNSTKVEKWQGIRNDETKTITGGYLFVLLDEPKHEGEWVTRSTGHSVRNVSNRSEAVAKFHKEQVEKALSEGKLVPEEVLKDYPELVKPKEGKKLYRYYYSHRPPGIGTQPEGFIRHETWMPARTTPHGRTAFGWVEYDRPLTQEEITGYELFEDEAELPKLVSELVQFAKSEGIEEAMKELTSEYGKAVWEWLKSQKRIRAGMGQKEQIRAEILRLAGITEPAAPQQPSPGVQGMFDAYIRSTVLTTGALASPKFLNDEAMAQDIFKNIQVSMDEARRLVPQFRAIAEKRINKEEIESVKETFGIDLEQEAHNLGIDLAEYAIVKAGNKVVLKHKTIVQKRYEIKPPKGYMEEKERRVMAKLEAKRAAVPAVPPAAKPALTIQEIKQQVLGSIQAAGTLEDLQPILKGIGFLPLPEPEKHQLIDAYQNKYSLLLAERPFGAAVKAEEKPKVIGAPTPQQIVEAEQRRRAEEASRLRGQVPLFGGAAVSARLEQFEPGAMEKAKAEAELRKRIEQLGLPSTIHPVIQRLAASTQEVLKFGNKKAKDTVEDIVIRRYVQYCPPGTIIDNRNVPKVPEKWWVYPQKLRTCMTEIEQKLAGAGMVKENTHQELTQSMREYIRGAKDIRDVIHYFRDGRPPVQGVLYRARAGGYFVEASDGNIYDSMGWEDITQVRMSRAARA